MGLYRGALLQLASRDLAVTHAGLPTVRNVARGASPHQCLFPSGQHDSPLSLLLPSDRRPLAQRHGGGPVCPAPPARGVGGLGLGKKRRPEHFFLASHYVGLRGLCGRTLTQALPGRSPFLCPGTDGQTHAGHPSPGAASPGLLAVGPDRRGGPASGRHRGEPPTNRATAEKLLAADQGKNPLIRPGRPFLPDYRAGATRERLGDAPGHPAAGGPHRQRPGRLPEVPGEAALALSPSVLLSPGLYTLVAGSCGPAWPWRFCRFSCSTGPGAIPTWG